jgi:hypothetical protein
MVSDSNTTTTRTTRQHANTGRELLITEGQYMIAVVINSPILIKVLIRTVRCGQMLKLERTTHIDTTWR